MRVRSTAIHFLVVAQVEQAWMDVPTSPHIWTDWSVTSFKPPKTCEICDRWPDCHRFSLLSYHDEWCYRPSNGHVESNKAIYVSYELPAERAKFYLLAPGVFEYIALPFLYWHTPVCTLYIHTRRYKSWCNQPRWQFTRILSGSCVTMSSCISRFPHFGYTYGKTHLHFQILNA